MKSNKLNKIRFSIRNNFPETNSSSSHSVSISISGNYYKPDEWNIDIDNKGIIYIPNSLNDFSGEFKRYNDVLTKIQYVSSISIVKTNSKKLNLLKSVIKSFTGAKDIIFQWEEELQSKIKNLKDLGLNIKDNLDLYSLGSYVTDESLIDQIFESRSTLKNFIFSPNSWLFLGNDSMGYPVNFFNVSNTIKEPDAIASVDFGGNIGRIDFEIPKYPDTISVVEKILKDELQILQSIVIDRTTGIPKINELTCRNCYSYNNSIDITQYNNDNLFLFSIISYHQKKFFIKEKPFIFYSSNDLINEIREKHNTINLDQLLKTKSSPRDYKIFPIHLITKEFGELI